MHVLLVASHMFVRRHAASPSARRRDPPKTGTASEQYGSSTATVQVLSVSHAVVSARCRQKVKTLKFMGSHLSGATTSPSETRGALPQDGTTADASPSKSAVYGHPSTNQLVARQSARFPSVRDASTATRGRSDGNCIPHCGMPPTFACFCPNRTTATGVPQ